MLFKIVHIDCQNNKVKSNSSMNTNVSKKNIEGFTNGGFSGVIYQVKVMS